MNHLNLHSIHPLLKILLTLVVMFVVGTAFGLIGSVLSMFAFDLSLAEVLDVISGKSNVAAPANMKFNQAIQSVGLFIVPGIIMSFLFANSKTGYIPFRRPIFWQDVFWVGIATLVLVPLIYYAVHLNQSISFPESMSDFEDALIRMEDSMHNLMLKMLSASTIGGLIINLLIIAVIPAIGEEFIFRGLIQKAMNEWFKNVHLSILLTAILFSAFHMQFYGFIPRTLLGMYLGYLFVWSRSIWVPVLAHFVNNAAAVIAYYLYNNGHIESDPDEIGMDGQIYYVALSALLFTSMIYFYRNYQMRRHANQTDSGVS